MVTHAAAGELPSISNGLRPAIRRYSTTPSEYTSVAVEIGSPLICSGLVWAVVNTRPPGRGLVLRVADQLGNAEIEQLHQPVVRDHSTPCCSISRRYASCTSAVGCSVWSVRSAAMYRRAMFRSSS